MFELGFRLSVKNPRINACPELAYLLISSCHFTREEHCEMDGGVRSRCGQATCGSCGPRHLGDAGSGER